MLITNNYIKLLLQVHRKILIYIRAGKGYINVDGNPLITGRQIKNNLPSIFSRLQRRSRNPRKVTDVSKIFKVLFYLLHYQLPESKARSIKIILSSLLDDIYKHIQKCDVTSDAVSYFDQIFLKLTL